MIVIAELLMDNKRHRRHWLVVSCGLWGMDLLAFARYWAIIPINALYL